MINMIIIISMIINVTGAPADRLRERQLALRAGVRKGG